VRSCIRVSRDFRTTKSAARSEFVVAITNRKSNAPHRSMRRVVRETSELPICLRFRPSRCVRILVRVLMRLCTASRRSIRFTSATMGCRAWVRHRHRHRRRHRRYRVDVGRVRRRGVPPCPGPPPPPPPPGAGGSASVEEASARVVTMPVSTAKPRSFWNCCMTFLP
jgi:hypothetical protein